MKELCTVAHICTQHSGRWGLNLECPLSSKHTPWRKHPMCQINNAIGTSTPPSGTPPSSTPPSSTPPSRAVTESSQTDQKLLLGTQLDLKTPNHFLSKPDTVFRNRASNPTLIYNSERETSQRVKEQAASCTQTPP